MDEHLQLERQMFGTSGFYKKHQDGDEQPQLFYGPNAVHAPNYTLTRENKDNLQFPVDGWYWFESEEEARIALDMPLPEEETES